jgi:hypothetical protein
VSSGIQQFEDVAGVVRVTPMSGMTSNNAGCDKWLRTCLIHSPKHQNWDFNPFYTPWQVILTGQMPGDSVHELRCEKDYYHPLMFPPAMKKFWFSLPGLALMFLVISCSINPPVQEMSNARQAIQSAYDVKAQVYAPEPLTEAEQSLQQATNALDSGDYSTAREYAITAQQQAIKARQQALANNKHAQ